MTAEPITPAHLEKITRWWEKRGDGHMPPDVLPPDGYCVCDSEGPLAAAWLYRPVGCKVAIVDWLVSRPRERPAYVRPAARAVFEALQALAETNGCTRIFASVSRAGMIREALSCGFHITEGEHTHLVKFL
jgi:hypothetical protein